MFQFANILINIRVILENFIPITKRGFVKFSVHDFQITLYTPYFIALQNSNSNSLILVSLPRSTLRLVCISSAFMRMRISLIAHASPKQQLLRRYVGKWYRQMHTYPHTHTCTTRSKQRCRIDTHEWEGVQRPHAAGCRHRAIIDTQIT